MSIFPTKILLATDGSQDAELAATTAVDLAKTTGSELHVMTVFPGSAYVLPYYETHSQTRPNGCGVKLERNDKRY